MTVPTALRLVAAAVLAGAIPSFPGAPARAQDPAPAFEPALDEIEDLPAGPGQEETFYTCTACHGLALIKSQGMSRERWDETVGLMVQAHKMPEPSREERERIVSYLAEHFPPRQQGRGWQNPFLKR
jgi:hypothetical protein